MLLAEQADRTNAVVASGKALATCLGLSEPTISRAIKLLQTADENELPYLEVLKSAFERRLNVLLASKLN